VRSSHGTLRTEDEPAATITASMDNGNFQWQLRNNTSANAGVRVEDEPAPTMYFGARLNKMTWEPVAANEGTTAEDMAWVHERPAPTVVASYAPDVMAKPAYRKAGDGPRQKAKGSVRVTLTEAAILQSFSADYPWQGTSTQRFQQVGNAIPPLLAQAIIEALTGGTP
jgi:DNA (cytosine-5)-methyltransferase 1